MRWVGCCLFMDCWVEIPEKRAWRPVTPPVMHIGAPFCLNKYMYWHWFDEILASLRYKNREVQYEYRLFHMRQTEEVWNKNMADEFNPYWTNVLNHIMMEWYNKFAPGFICVRRKPHYFGNEFHTTCCGLTSILWRAQIFEWKNIPAHLGPKINSEHRRTVGLMIQVCEPLFYMVKAVVMDSFLCVSNEIVDLAAKGLCYWALTKKHGYCPKSVPGDLIGRNFLDKEVEDVDMLEATK